jgi:predicted ATP-dependent Lon-type protease
MSKKIKSMKGVLREAYPDSHYNKEQMKMGIKIEMEHTRNKKVAKRIVKHHLDEFPDNYYTELIKMEKKLKK